MSWLLPPLEPHFEAAMRDVRAQGVAARVAAARRLARPEAGRELDARQGLRALLQDREPSVRAAALDSLGVIGNREDHDLVLPMIEDADPWNRELAVIALSHIDHPQRAATLREALRHPSPEVRFQALQSCTALMPEVAAERAHALSADPDPQVRIAAIRALATADTADGPGRARLLQLLDDRVEEVRWEAALALSPHGERGALQVLLPALEHRDRVLDTLDALSHYRTRAARSAVQAIAESVLKSPLLAAAAARSLLEMGERDHAVSALRRVLRALRSEGRNLALQTIAQAHLTELGPELERLSRFRRGMDLELLVHALAAVADSCADARRALHRLARRSDTIGHCARLALDGVDAPPAVPTGLPGPL